MSAVIVESHDMQPCVGLDGLRWLGHFIMASTVLFWGGVGFGISRLLS